MNQKTLFALWGGFYALCAALGFIPNPEGALKVLLTLLSLAHFVPPLLLIHCGDVNCQRLVRNLAAIWLVLTAALLIANMMSVTASTLVGNILYSLLVIISSPMVCSQFYALALFGWAWLLFDSLNELKKQ